LVNASLKLNVENTGGPTRPLQSTANVCVTAPPPRRWPVKDIGPARPATSDNFARSIANKLNGLPSTAAIDAVAAKTPI
jgi:hypothetical protein